LTPKATEQLQVIEKLSQKLRDRMMRGLTETQIDAGLNVMRRIRDNLEECLEEE